MCSTKSGLHTLTSHTFAPSNQTNAPQTWCPQHKNATFSVSSSAASLIFLVCHFTRCNSLPGFPPWFPPPVYLNLLDTCWRSMYINFGVETDEVASKFAPASLRTPVLKLYLCPLSFFLIFCWLFCRHITSAPNTLRRSQDRFSRQKIERFFWRDFSGEELLPENGFLGQ